MANYSANKVTKNANQKREHSMRLHGYVSERHAELGAIQTDVEADQSPPR
jgi:ferritin